MAKYNSVEKTWSGPTQPGILNPEANVSQVVLDLLSRTPDKVIQFNADNGDEMTCAEMKRRIVRVALNLKKLGYGLGDLVTMVCTNSENVVPVYFGCVTMGLVVNPLAPVFKGEDLAHMMRLTQSKIVFCDEKNREVVEEAVSEAIREEPRIYVMGVSSGSSISVDELLVPTEEEQFFQPPYLGDSKTLTATILCSSGTTGSPKGVCLSHAHLIAGELFSDTLNAGPIFNFSPLFWMTGLFAAYNSLLYTRPRVITTRSFDADSFLSIVAKYQVEDVFTPPSAIVAIQDHPRYNTVQLGSLKRWILGGTTVSPELVNCLSQRFKAIDIKNVYGCSECGVVTSAMGSTGTLTRNMAVKIVGKNGKKLGPNEKGEVCLKNKYRFLGYFNNEEMSAKAFDDEGFYRTGDVGYFDSDGLLFVVDRIKDIIKFMNYQISPSDLEDIILQINGVRYVCIVGVPTADQSSDLVTAVIVLQPGSSLTERSVVDTVNGQVGDYKRLRGGVYFVDQLPMTPAGKVLRRAVKEMIVEGRCG